MKITSNTGSYSCSSPEEFAACLRTCFAAKAGNEIWCALEERKFPCLSILVNGEQAFVNYFAKKDGDMAASIGDEKAKGSVEFCGGQYQIAAYQIIPASSAMECALAFFRSRKLPDCIKWETL